MLARGRLMWYVYHVTLVGVARSWAAMSLLARSGYVVLHALGLAFFFRLLMQPIRYQLPIFSTESSPNFENESLV